MSVSKIASTMAGVLLMFLICTLFVTPSQAAKIPWRTSLPAALNESKRSGKPLFVNFSAEWCGPCQLMAKKVFPNESLNAELRRWIPVYIDIDKQEKLGEKYKITTMPLFYAMKKDGAIVSQISGYQSADDLIKWLKANYSKARR